MKETVKKLAVRSGAISLLLLFLVVISLPNLVDLENYRSLVVAAIQSRVPGTVTVHRLRLSISREIGVKMVGFSIADGDHQEISAAAVKIGFRIWPLLHRQLQISSVRLYRPTIRLRADQELPFGSGLFRSGVPLLPSESSCTTIAPVNAPLLVWCNRVENILLQIKDGTVIFEDQKFCAVPVVTRLEDLQLSLCFPGGKEPAPFTLSTAAKSRRHAGTLTLEGTLGGVGWPLDWGRMMLVCRVRGAGLDADQYWPYYQRWVPMRHIGALVSVDGSYDGDLLGHFSSRGTVSLADVDLDYQQVFAEQLPIKRLAVSYQFSLGENYNSIAIPEVKVVSPDFTIWGSCFLDDIRSGRKGRIRARANSNAINLARLYRYLPSRIMSDRFRDFWSEAAPGGQVMLQNGYLAGSYDEIAGIGRQPIEAHLVGGSLQFAGVSLQFPGLPERWQNVAGTLELAGEGLSFRDLDAELPPVLRQRLNGRLKNCFRAPEVKMTGKVSLALTKRLPLANDLRIAGAALLSRRMPAVGRFLAECSQFNGRLTGSFEVEGGGAGHQLVWGLTCAGEQVVVGHPLLGRPLTINSGQLSASPRQLKCMDVLCDVGSSTVRLAGQLDDYGDRQRRHGAFSVHADALQPEDFSIIPHCQVTWGGEVGKREPSRLALWLSMASGDLSTLTVDGMVDLRHLKVATSYLPHEVEDFSLLAESRGQEVAIRHCRCRTGESDVKVAGTVAYRGNRFRVSLAGNAETLFLDDFHRVLPAQDYHKAGELPATGPAGPVIGERGLTDYRQLWQRWRSRFAELAIDGVVTRLKLKQAELFPGEPVLSSADSGVLSDLVLRFRLADDQLELDRLSFVKGRSDLQVSGQLLVDQQGNLHGSLDHQSRQLVLADFTANRQSPPAAAATAADSSGQKQDGGGRRQPLQQWRHFWRGHEISFTSRIELLTGRAIELMDMACQVEVTGDRLLLTSFNSAVWQGNVKAAGSWDLAGDRVSLTLHLDQVDLAKLNESLTLYPEKDLPLEGAGALNMELQWQGMGDDQWRHSLDGEADFSFAAGRLKRFKMLANIASLLNVSQLLTLKLPDLSEGVPYDTLTGRILFADGVMHTDDLLLKGPAANISAAGTISLPAKMVDMEIGVQPLQTIDKAIAAVPVVGYIITGEGKTLIVMPFAVSGPFGQTRVSAIPVQGLVGRTGGILKRLITTPVRVLSWPGKVISPAGEERPAEQGSSKKTEDKQP
ncbi:MAG: AsmA-like C-terminal domain-containing protein [Deltaproteobacteria bacterium]|nr:AsmA-like C-terminal domain-containing protein [Candidatus Anaeroferrophillus wilburensis]MBN2889244.1 AsmA-like C-terminal domain-containing protein [Deltaproteobacteria bacterium]